MCEVCGGQSHLSFREFMRNWLMFTRLASKDLPGTLHRAPGKKVDYTRAFESQSPCQILRVAYALASPDVRKRMGAGLQ